MYESFKFLIIHTHCLHHCAICQTEAYIAATLSWRKAFCIEANILLASLNFSVRSFSSATLQCQLITHRYDAAVWLCCSTHCAAKLFGGMIGFLLIGLAARHSKKQKKKTKKKRRIEQSSTIIVVYETSVEERGSFSRPTTQQHMRMHKEAVPPLLAFVAAPGCAMLHAACYFQISRTLLSPYPAAVACGRHTAAAKYRERVKINVHALLIFFFLSL